MNTKMLNFNENQILELNEYDFDAVHGGFICAGVCVAALAGAAFFGGAGIGFMVARGIFQA